MEACKSVTELQILEDAQLKAKFRKLAFGVREARAEVGQVTFEFNVNITELQLNCSPQLHLRFGSSIELQLRKAWLPSMPQSLTK